MATIRVVWRRVVQTQPYETATVELSVEEAVEMPALNPDPKAAEARAGKLAEMQKEIARKLGEAGDQIVAKLLMAPDYPRKPKAPGKGQSAGTWD